MSSPGLVRRVALPALVALALVVVTVALLVGRVNIEGQRELRTAESLSAAGKTELAILHARRAAEWYAPGAPHVPAAYQKLVALARLSESRGDPASALLAWRAVRHAALSSRWAVVSYADELQQANASIARLASRSSTSASIGAPPVEELQGNLAEGLSRDVHPRTSWVAVMLLGFAMLAGGAGYAVQRGATGQGYSWLQARWALAVAAAGAVAWALGVWFA